MISFVPFTYKACLVFHAQDSAQACSWGATTMGKQKLNIKDLSTISFPSAVSKSLSLNIMNRHFKHLSNADKLALIRNVLDNPREYADDERLSVLAYKLSSGMEREEFSAYELNDEPKHFDVFGSRHIDQNAIKQMAMVMRLPVALKGALMPDAHQGYGMPIGGVVATRNEVIPYGIGMDIGCRMALSILDLPASYVGHRSYEIRNILRDHTHFGNDGEPEVKQNHDVLDDPTFGETPLLKKLHGNAVRQLGSSGAGNHFVEVGTIEVADENRLGVDAGSYTAILSHSGSRGLGANIAQHYTAIAMDTCRLPHEAKHLAWLNLDTEAGQEYWLSMNLAGVYAKACHDVIHRNICNALGARVMTTVENHHNFAWKEKLLGDEYIVHRKGATPAGVNVAGIIPGSMTTPGYVVSGLGNEASLNSAAHGAGRKMSRLKARTSITMSSLKKLLQKEGVMLLGGSAEEAPMCYKDIEMVMKSQAMLVNVEGRFFPQVVRMA